MDQYQDTQVWHNSISNYPPIASSLRRAPPLCPHFGWTSSTPSWKVGTNFISGAKTMQCTKKLHYMEPNNCTILNIVCTIVDQSNVFSWHNFEVWHQHELKWLLCDFFTGWCTQPELFVMSFLVSDCVRWSHVQFELKLFFYWIVFFK